MPVIIAIFTALAGGHAAYADDRGRVKSTQVLVEQGGGEVEVTLHPSLITNLFLPEPIARVLASDQKNFIVRQMGNAVAIRPRYADTKLSANVVIMTETIKLTIILKIASDPAAAQSQVIFRKAEAERALEARINSEVAKRMEVEKARRGVQVEKTVAERVFQRFDAERLAAIERNGDNVIVRATRLVYVGDAAYLLFSIQNRSRTAYQVATVAVHAGGKQHKGLVVFEGTISQGPILTRIRPSQTATGLVVIADVRRLAGTQIALEIAEPGGKRAVSVGGIAVR